MKIDINLAETSTLADLGLEEPSGTGRSGVITIEESLVKLLLGDGRTVALELSDGALQISVYNASSPAPTQVIVPEVGRIEADTFAYDASFPPGQDLPLAI